MWNLKTNFMNRQLFALLFILTLSFQSINAQYFGQNKVQYNRLNFKVVESKTFDMYHYLNNDSLVKALVKDAEKWHIRHHQVFKDSFDYKIPLIIYSNHGGFQQTNTISGLIGPTTGGVTEGLKNRVIFPLTPSYAQTDHVLGHELVHAHQYNMIKSSDSLSFNNMANIPLWMTEGMAEYLSIGSTDPHTAMWMRDAVAHDYFPRIKDLHKSRYFPYRFGHAFWAFVAGTFGDDQLFPLYEETAKLGVKEAFKVKLNMPIDSFSVRWKETSENFYKPQMQGRSIEAIGTKLIDSKNGGRLNITPSVSPDGKFFIFLSERNIFSLDLFIASTKTGKILRKISTRTHESHKDALDAFESAGTWSPDSKKYAFVIYSRGRNKIAIAETKKGRIIDEFFIPNIPAFNNIDWSPDGKKILFSGLVEGQSDLYTVNVETKEVVQYSTDYFANMQPKWSPDGKSIVFATDNLNKKSRRPTRNQSFNILHIENNTIHAPDIFPNSNNLNPCFSADGKLIYFLSDREGFRDLYQYEIETGIVKQLTYFYTGISGITRFAPAISVSHKTNEILYSHYYDSKYNIYKVKIDSLKSKVIDPTIENRENAKLPSLNLKKSFVDVNLANENILTDTLLLTKRDYRPKFKLDYISSGGVGISTGRYGTGMAGGVNLLFGDMLGENQLYIGVMLNGELQDFGGQAAYLNRKSRFAWGGAISHIPFRFVTFQRAIDTIPDTDILARKDTYNLYRIFKEQASVFSYYPFSKMTRIEGSASFNYYSFRLDRYNYYFDQYNRQYNVDPRERNVAGAGDPFAMQEVSLAYVGDDSSFGLTAPMRGYRYRFEVQQTFGRINMTSVLTDARKYLYLKPLTLAFKAFHYSRLGKDASNNLMPPLYLGYESLIRGYTYRAILNSNSEGIYNDLQGSKMFLSNFEIRLPFTGPERLALIKSRFLFTDLNLFVDAGVTWGDYRTFNRTTGSYSEESRRLKDSKIITSLGISTRINVFGQLILEPYFAFPMQLEGKTKGVFGINFTPGW